MSLLVRLGAACAALVTAGTACGQSFNVGYVGSQMLVRPPTYALGFGAFNPNYSAPMFVPGVGYAYYPNTTGLRPSYWSLPGRFSAYPWSGAGVYTGGTGVYAYYWPTFLGSSSAEVGLASAFDNFGPYAGATYGQSFDGGAVYQAPVAVGGNRFVLWSPSTEPGAPPNQAILSVQVPADAKVWIQGTETKQRGAERTFISPTLKPGQDYTYAVKAAWKVNDKMVEQTQNVTVHAGERTGLLFLSGVSAKTPQGR